MVFELLNVQATPHIKTICYPTINTARWSKNEFVDPEDNEIWDEQDLSPIEKGHVYLWKEDSEGWIHIFMPYRIMDLETARFVKNFKSYRSTAPFSTGKNTALDRFTKSHKSCLQNFKFTKEYFPVFKERVENFDGLLEKDEVDLDSFVARIQAVRETSKQLSVEMSEQREAFCTTNSLFVMDSKDKKDLALAQFSISRNRVLELASEKIALAKTLDRLSKEVGRETAYIEADEWFKTLSEEIEILRGVNFERLEREVIHKYRVDTGEVLASTKPPTVMSLDAELKALKQYYPSLNNLKVSGSDIYLELPGLKIMFLSDGSIKVVGDPASLKPYLEGATQVKAKGRRRRAISAKEENHG
tara:strand:+ start:180 stop:1256 length:1077 start_codon:yes stop_codon:yes gene_type:complete